MKSFWKIAIPVTCVVLICGAAITWQVRKERKLAEAARVFRLSAEQGDAKSQYSLGDVYYHGQGVPQDYTQALRWYRKAADQGDAKAEYGLGNMYEFGQGVLLDYAEALSWYHKAADQGYAKAQFNLGDMHYYGYGVPQDNAEAVRWYRKASDQGLARAQYDLGYMHYHGYGVPQDRAEADRWYQKAAAQGDEYAQRSLGQKMSTVHKVNYSVMFLCFLLLLKSSGLPTWPLRGTRQRTAALTGILGILLVALSLFGFYHFGIRRAGSDFYGYESARSLLLGIVIVMFISLVLPERAKPMSAKIALAIFGILFLCPNLLLIFALYHRMRFIPVPAFCTFNGIFIGLSIPLVIFLWRRHKNTGGGQYLDSEASTSDPQDESESESNQM